MDVAVDRIIIGGYLWLITRQGDIAKGGRTKRERVRVLRTQRMIRSEEAVEEENCGSYRKQNEFKLLCGMAKMAVLLT